MREFIEAVRLAGRTVRVEARAPLPVDSATLAIKTAIRVFERYPVLHQLVLATSESEVAITRDEIESSLGPEGFAGLREWGRARQVLARAVQAYQARQKRS